MKQKNKIIKITLAGIVRAEVIQGTWEVLWKEYAWAAEIAEAIVELQK
jgi:hypothetical protein